MERLKMKTLQRGNEGRQDRKGGKKYNEVYDMSNGQGGGKQTEVANGKWNWKFREVGFFISNGRRWKMW